jgi:hypothetical protein
VHELLRLDPPVDGVVSRARTEVLRDGDDVRAGFVEVAQGPLDLMVLLAHAEDEIGLGHQAGIAAHGDDVERPLVAERRADPLEDAGDRLDVVRPDLGARIDHLAHELRDGVEVGDEDLHAGAGVEGVHLPDGLGVEPGPAVDEVVAGHSGDGGVAKAHPADALGDAAGLVPVERRRPAGVDLAEVAAPRALLAADEEGGLAVLPALEDVGAAGFLADGVQSFGLHHGVELGVLGAHLRRRADPRRLALDGGLGVARFHAQQAPALRSDGHGCCLSESGRMRVPGYVSGGGGLAVP